MLTIECPCRLQYLIDGQTHRRYKSVPYVLQGLGWRPFRAKTKVQPGR
jgi:hypothetical protein